MGTSGWIHPNLHYLYYRFDRSGYRFEEGLNIPPVAVSGALALDCRNPAQGFTLVTGTVMMMGGLSGIKGSPPGPPGVGPTGPSPGKSSGL